MRVILPTNQLSGHAGAVQSIAGGAGRDKVTFESFHMAKSWYALTVDVPRRAIRMQGRRWAQLASVEKFKVDGNGARDHVTFRGGRKSESFKVPSVNGVRVRAFGRGGNDVLVSGNRNDLLHGGPGRDRLSAGPGRDRCVAGERLRSCERRR